MKNLVQPGRQVTIAAPYALSAGEGALVGSLFGVAFGDAENGAPVDILCEGVVDLAKNAASVFVVGQKVFFSTVDKRAHSNTDEDSNSGGSVAIGVAVAAAGAGATTVHVRLTQPAVAA
jgi:predicted RecA/RadA family phage recombinase